VWMAAAAVVLFFGAGHGLTLSACSCVCVQRRRTWLGTIFLLTTAACYTALCLTWSRKSGAASFGKTGVWPCSWRFRRRLGVRLRVVGCFDLVQLGRKRGLPFPLESARSMGRPGLQYVPVTVLLSFVVLFWSPVIRSLDHPQRPAATVAGNRPGPPRNSFRKPTRSHVSGPAPTTPEHAHAWEASRMATVVHTGTWL
jgi:hypothetical protein